MQAITILPLEQVAKGSGSMRVGLTPGAAFVSSTSNMMLEGINSCAVKIDSSFIGVQPTLVAQTLETEQVYCSLLSVL